jgi:hypothetical protein
MESRLKSAFNHIESAGANTKALAEFLEKDHPEDPFKKDRIIDALKQIATQLEKAAAAFNQ